MLAPPDTLEMGWLHVNKEQVLRRDINEHVRSYLETYRDRNVRVIQHTKEKTEDSTSSTYGNFEIFCASLIRNVFLPEYITEFEHKNYKYFILENGPRFDDIFEGSNSIDVDTFRSIMHDLAEAAQYAMVIEFGFREVFPSDVFIIDDGVDREGHTRYHAKLSGIEGWKYQGNGGKKLVNYQNYTSVIKDIFCSRSRTHYALGQYFRKMSIKLNADEGSARVLENLIEEIENMDRGLNFINYHLFYWDVFWCIEFLSDVSDWLKHDSSSCSAINHQDTSLVFDRDAGWQGMIEDTVILDATERGSKLGELEFQDTTHQIYYLIPGIRNTCERNHFSNGYFKTPIELCTHFSLKFPRLLLFTYSFVKSHAVKDPHLSKKYNLTPPDSEF